MKSFKIPMFLASLFGFCFFSGIETPPAYADFTFGNPQNLGPVINTPSYEWGATTSTDGLELYFISTAPGGYGGWDIYVSTRQSVSDSWGTPSNLGVTVNSPVNETFAKLSWDGLTLYFSDIDPGPYRTGGLGGSDIWMSTRASRTAPWGTPVNVGAPINGSVSDASPSLSGDGLTLVFASYRDGGYGGTDLWMSTRLTMQGPWGAPVNLGPNVNSGNSDFYPTLSADGLALFLCSDRAGGFGSFDVWMTTRKSISAPWGPAVNLGPVVNIAALEAPGGLSGDMTTLYIISDRPGGLGAHDVWQVPILPVVDFNGDGKVDLVDLVMLIESWGTNNTLYDIGPMPWGDGVVDIEDLKVFIKYWEQENMPKNPQGGQ